MTIHTLPRGAPVAPFKGRHKVKVDPKAETPLIDKRDPADKQFQRHLTSHSRAFNLSTKTGCAAFDAVWTKIATGLAISCNHPEPVYDVQRGRWVAFLRWADVEIKLPS